MAGRDFLSFISSVLRDFLLVQSRSSAVYASAGSISKMSAFTACAMVLATVAVVPVAEKYTTSAFLFMFCAFKLRQTKAVAKIDNIIRFIFL